MKKNAFYFIKDEFFDIVNEPYLKGNKKSSRPHYYWIEDIENHCYWVIPLSSRVKKFKAIQDRILKKRKRCDLIHIVDIAGRGENAFLIQDIFPITEKYISNEFIVNGQPLVLKSQNTINEIEKKAKRVINMKLRGVKLIPTQADVNKILNMIKDGTL